MKKRILWSVGSVVLTTITALTFMPQSHANNAGFPVVDKRVQQAAAAPARYFVKYHAGKEQQVRELLRSYEIEIVDALVKQQVLVVTGEKQQIEQLGHSELIDYTEPEPTRMLYAQ
ncbi:ATPase [Vibrio navarrensis]|uniref:ATPase n=1 Tax=Vibrio navarrensis TaxID=29495 RepID=A0AAJ4LWB6_9VIBR|nr:MULTISPECIES: hypothetical protein [Vibrio]KJR30669.1 ATPase [Vibrio sp. S234-5]MBE3652993.1 ATPase [Vibrio navarrensis]MBE3655093.1 ATPase [Vibrio navarrensis]MBE3659747.1 ATPase [Vibrio navarrensis]MBE4592904.1 ATPase [Vibrio navarrensis]